VVIFIYRADVYQTNGGPSGAPASAISTAELHIAKQRNGPLGTVDLLFNKTYTRFDNLAHGHEGAP
jgi:replicative DNA helicase